MPGKQEEWRQKLVALKSDLTAMDHESSGSRGAVELDQTRVGRLSRMDALQEQAMNSAISERRRMALSRIDAALERLDDGEFGFCLKCGEEIAEKRLEFDPTTPLCVSCCG